MPPAWKHRFETTDGCIRIQSLLCNDTTPNAECRSMLPIAKRPIESTSDGPYDLKVGATHPAFDAALDALGVASWGFISAANPMSQAGPACQSRPT